MCECVRYYGNYPSPLPCTGQPPGSLYVHVCVLLVHITVAWGASYTIVIGSDMSGFSIHTTGFDIRRSLMKYRTQKAIQPCYVKTKRIFFYNLFINNNMKYNMAHFRIRRIRFKYIYFRIFYAGILFLEYFLTEKKNYV